LIKLIVLEFVVVMVFLTLQEVAVLPPNCVMEFACLLERNAFVILPVSKVHVGEPNATALKDGRVLLVINLFAEFLAKITEFVLVLIPVTAMELVSLELLALEVGAMELFVTIMLYVMKPMPMLLPVPVWMVILVLPVITLLALLPVYMVLVLDLTTVTVIMDGLEVIAAF
jgi:hypothetical protein